jgi:hypothetical protein
VHKHYDLLRDYAHELQSAKAFAEKWWAYQLAATAAQSISPAAADQALRRRWPDGPASHPRVLAVVRKYWLACDALNRSYEVFGPAASDDDSSDYVLAPDADPYEEAAENEKDGDDHDGQVEPHVFVLEWLIDDDHEQLAEFLGSLSYWPIGVDENDQYV